MIAGEVERHELHLYGLGKEKPPENVAKALKELCKELELIWNEDDNRWEIYRQYQGKLIWQNSAPVTGTAITPGLKVWLQKFDTSKGGAKGEDERRRDFRFHLKNAMARQRKRQQDDLKLVQYETGNMSKWLMRYMEGNRQVVVPAGPPIGITKDGKAIRAYKKRSPTLVKTI